MNSALILIITVILFAVAYVVYGRYIEKLAGVDPERKTPAVKINDGKDYVPTNRYVLFGHHFAAIAGIGPILGPVIAMAWGWLPGLLWILFGCVFAGMVQDFMALFTSVRRGGKTVASMLDILGSRTKRVFQIFLWVAACFTLGLFTLVTASAWVAAPPAATSSLLFCFIAVIVGVLMYRTKFGIVPSTIVGLILLVLALFTGLKLPIELSIVQWSLIILIYAFIASILPVRTLLQPRDYLNTWIMLGGTAVFFITIMIVHPTLQMPATTSFTVNGRFLWPFMFVTIACGAISGGHTWIASGTTSKQVENEKDCRPIAMGGMLGEGIVAVIALLAISAGMDIPAYQSITDPVSAFAAGMGGIFGELGVSTIIASYLIILWVSCFALTTLDTGARIGRYVLEEAGLKNSYLSTLITVLLAGLLLFSTLIGVGYDVSAATNFWIGAFGTMNQYCGAIVLSFILIWLWTSKRSGKIALPGLIILLPTATAAAILIGLAGFSGVLPLIPSIVTLAIVPIGLYIIISAFRFYKKISK